MSRLHLVSKKIVGRRHDGGAGAISSQILLRQISLFLSHCLIVVVVVMLIVSVLHVCVVCQPDEKGRVNSIVTVLLQEVDRFNKLLVVIKVVLIFHVRSTTCC